MKYLFARKLFIVSTKCFQSPNMFHIYYRTYYNKCYKPIVSLTAFSIYFYINNSITHNHADIINTSLVAIPLTNNPIHDSNTNTTIETTNCHNNIITSIHSIAEYLTNVFKSIYRISVLWLYFLPPIILSPILLIQIPIYNQWWWDVLRSSICNAGPCFIKFSQWAATRPDLFKESICIELSKLQSLTYIHNWKHTEEILVHSFGLDWSTYISIPQKDQIIGSGCVAQVYKGILYGDVIIDDDIISTKNLIPTHNTSTTDHNSTIPVAIKILHPGIREALQTDLLLLRTVTAIIENISGNILFLYDSIYHNHNKDPLYLKSTVLNPLVCISLRDSMDEFALFMEQQLDMYEEGKALSQFQQNFRKNKQLCDKVIIPKPWYIYRKKRNHSINDRKDNIDSKIILSNVCIDDDNHYTNKNYINSAMNILEGYQCISKHKDILLESYEEGTSMIDILHNLHHNNDYIISNNHNNYSVNNNFSNSINSNEEIDLNSIDQYKSYLAELGLDIILKMIFEDNFIHADLHAGNILVRFPNHNSSNNNTNSNNTNNTNNNTSKSSNSSYNNTINNIKQSLLTLLPSYVVSDKQTVLENKIKDNFPKIILLDAGLTVQLQFYDRKNFIALFKAVLENDGREVARLIMEYRPTTSTRSTRSNDDILSNNNSILKSTSINDNSIIDPEGYKNKMQELVNNVHKEGLLLSKISVSMLLKQLLKISYDHNVKLESRFVSVILSIILAEGMGKQLDSNINIILKATPYIRNAALNLLFTKK